jgi:predicted nucleic-acid-binding protein
MFALDTNVLVRYIVQDDKGQAEKATKIIEGLSVDTPAFISCIVLCEINWVLKSAYKTSKQDRLSVLQNLLSVPVFDIECLGSCVRALKSYQEGRADFSDYLIQDIGRAHGYDTLLTFDKNAQKSKGFKGL